MNFDTNPQAIGKGQLQGLLPPTTAGGNNSCDLGWIGATDGHADELTEQV
jgi:hypothetical protein